MTTKRLFFGFHVDAPWPSPLPSGRIIPENSRHCTLAFLGNYDYQQLADAMHSMPSLPFSIGKTGFFDQCLFLPEKHPHVAAWHAKWFDSADMVKKMQQELVDWLKMESKKEWLCHVTIARAPFDKQEWQQAFQPLPFIITHLHLYESFPESNYKSLWSKPFIAPFEEFEHTADIAFAIRGSSVQQIFWNAFTALCWRFPPLLSFKQEVEANTLDDVIIALNHLIGLADEQFGCPYKAISFHGDLKQKQEFLEWEMIVDV